MVNASPTFLRAGPAAVGVPYDGNGSPLHYGAAYDYEILCPGDVNGDRSVGTDDLAIGSLGIFQN